MSSIWVTNWFVVFLDLWRKNLGRSYIISGGSFFTKGTLFLPRFAMPICLITPDVSPMILWESSQKVGGGGRRKGESPSLPPWEKRTNQLNNLNTGANIFSPSQFVPNTGRRQVGEDLDFFFPLKNLTDVIGKLPGLSGQKCYYKPWWQYIFCRKSSAPQLNLNIFLRVGLVLWSTIRKLCISDLSLWINLFKINFSVLLFPHFVSVENLLLIKFWGDYIISFPSFFFFFLFSSFF